MAQRHGSISASTASKAKQWLKSKLKRDDTTPFAANANAIDSKTPSRISKHAGRILQFCQNKRLKLKNSPPYLQGILLDTQDHINVVFSKQSIEELKSNEYLCVFVNKFVLHAKRTTKLFKDAREQMENEQSDWRRELTKYTLVFSHMLAEIKALSPGGVFVSEFTVVKAEAREFWTKFFKDRLIVPWAEFLLKLTIVHEVCSEEEAVALKKTMDITENDHISCFEFDVFTRLFQPWKQLLNNWNVIVIRHPAYHAFITYDEVERMLHQFQRKPGSYVFRLSCTRLGSWAIGFVSSENKIVQTIPQSKSLYQALIDGAEQGTYTYPCGQDNNPDLREQIRTAPQERIKVTKEQYDIYCEIDSTFEMCKICNSNLKSIRIDPCGHLLCQKCLSHWMETSGRKTSTKCPFCRKTVVTTEKVLIEPFDPFGDDDEDEDDLEDVDSVLNAAGSLTGLNSPICMHAFKAARRDSYSQPQTPVSPTPSGLPSPPARTGLARPTSHSDLHMNSGMPPLPAGSSNSRPSTRSQPVSRMNSRGSGGDVDVNKLRQLTEEMGFAEDQATKALRVSRNNLQVAMDILLQYP